MQLHAETIVEDKKYLNLRFIFEIMDKKSDKVVSGSRKTIER